jgi:predicted metal-dependent phosphoesterase TrpH
MADLEPGRVIMGEEIMTREGGELLAAYVEEQVPAGLPAAEAIAFLRAQGAFISVSHPFDRGRGWPPAALAAITPLVDAVEGFNARCLRAAWNDEAHAYARAHGLLETVGSDAHHPNELGRATLLLPEFHDAASLKAALTQAEPRLRLSSPLVHLYSRWAVWVKALRGERRRYA